MRDLTVDEKICRDVYKTLAEGWRELGVNGRVQCMEFLINLVRLLNQPEDEAIKFMLERVKDIENAQYTK